MNRRAPLADLSTSLPSSANVLLPVQIVTQRVADSGGDIVRFVQDDLHPFDPICLDAGALAAQGLIDGAASAGRGNTVFFSLHNGQFVLRHYRRGGLVRHISTMHYLYTGLHRTRAIREFDLLILLQKKGLSAPVPYACGVQRRGLFYRASLVTRRLSGQTLAERLLKYGCLSRNKATDESLWRGVGELIARFHAAGVFHADLNAHNIMLDDEGGPTLIDFDRGRVRQLPDDPASQGWCLANIDRLERSLVKIARTSPTGSLDADTVIKAFSNSRDQWAGSVRLLAGV